MGGGGNNRAIAGAATNPLDPVGGALLAKALPGKPKHQAQGPAPVSTTNTTSTFNPLAQSAATGTTPAQSMWNPGGIPTAWGNGAQGKGTPPVAQGAASDTTRLAAPGAKG